MADHHRTELVVEALDMAHLNAAIYRTVIVRMRFHQPTIDYVTRRTTEGKTKREIIRCLKRYVIREVYHLIRPAPRTIPAAS